MVVAVQLYGQLCEIEQIESIAKERSLTLIQDACQAHGAVSESEGRSRRWGLRRVYPLPNQELGLPRRSWRSRYSSTIGDRRLRLLRNGGRRKGHVSMAAGINSRLDAIQAGFLRVFLPRLKAMNAARRRIAAIYEEGLAGWRGMRSLRRTSGSVCQL